VKHTSCQLSFSAPLADAVAALGNARVIHLQIFKREPFFHGHDNNDQLVKIARVHTGNLGVGLLIIIC